MRGDGRIFQRAGFYWVAYYLHGKEYREAAKTKDGKSTPDQKVAEKFLRDRLKDVHADEVGGRVFTTPKAFRLTVHDLVEALKADYELRGKLSAQNSSHLKRVQKDFGEYRSMDLTSERIDRYIEQRLDAGAAKASINRVTQMLGQAYKLAIRRGRLARPPYIRQLNESGNVRQGFFNEKEFVAVLAKLPSDLQDFASWCFATGMRKGEAASLTWGMLQGGELRIPGDICKNRKSRVLPLGSELARIIERRRAARRVVVKGVICMDACEFIFHRGGKPVGEFRKSWHSACVAAGLGKIACPACGSEAKAESVCRKCSQRRKYAGRIFHDFRRSCARRLIRAGVSREAAKRLTGHVSDSMFSRYAIVTNEDVLAAQEKIALSSAQG